MREASVVALWATANDGSLLDRVMWGRKCQWEVSKGCAEM